MRPPTALLASLRRALQVLCWDNSLDDYIIITCLFLILWMLTGILFLAFTNYVEVSALLVVADARAAGRGRTRKRTGEGKRAVFKVDGPLSKPT